MRAARALELLAQPLVEAAVVVEPRERVRLRLVLQPRPDLGVVERERGRVGEALQELELVVVEHGGLAEAVDVERALDRRARHERDRDERLRLVGGSARHRLHPGVEVRLVHARRLPPVHRPAGDALAEPDARPHDLVRPLVAGEHRDEQALRLVRLEDRQRVVGDELREGVRDPLEQRVEALLGEDVVEDVGEQAVRDDQCLEPLVAGPRGRRRRRGADDAQLG